MEPANQYAQAIAQHPSLQFLGLDQLALTDGLAGLHMLPSSRFYETIYITREVEGDEATYIFTLARVLRNQNAGVPTNTLKSVGSALLECLGLYSNTDMTRRARRRPQLVKMMQSCPLPYSFMGQLTEIDEINGELTRTPILIIPEAEDISAILNWQEENRVVKSESDLFTSLRGAY